MINAVTNATHQSGESEESYLEEKLAQAKAEGNIDEEVDLDSLMSQEEFFEEETGGSQGGIGSASLEKAMEPKLPPSVDNPDLMNLLSQFGISSK